MTNIIRLFIFILFYSLAIQTYAIEIVRLQIDYSGSLHTLDIELHDDVAPLTVANYLNYVNSGRYDGTFIYRNIPGFVLQTGGYTFRPNDLLNDPLRPIAENTGLELVPKDATVVNEFNLSNIRGTIALAKVADDPDSGSSEWFISLNNNSGNLDNQNGGFTVFGSVIDDGMATADEISLFPVHPTAGNVLGSAFSDLPVVNYDLNTLPAVLHENLVMILNISPISRPIVRITPNNGDFGLDVADDGAEELLNINLINKGDEELKIDSIETTNLVAPFSVNNDTCTTNSLQPNSPFSSCGIVISFSPTALGFFSGSIKINYSSTVNASTYSVTYAVSGEGVVNIPVLNTSPSTIDFGEIIISDSSNRMLTLTNIGGATVDLTSISLSGTNIDQFSIGNNGCSAGTMLQIEETCEIELTFNPDTTGIKTAILNVLSNTNSLIIGIAGVGTKPVITVPQSFDLGSAQVNQTVQNFFSISNSGTGNLTLNNVSISGVDGTFFTQDNNCPNTNNTTFPTQPLNSSGSCIIQINYTPTSPGTHTALLSIESTDPINPIVSIDLTGKTDTAIIQGPEAVNVGTSQINGVTSSSTITITNKGKAPLGISNITGLELTNFTQSNNCNIQINQNEICSILVTYNAQSIGSSSATMTIVSNDPLNSDFDILLSGFGDNDADGILSEVELSGPNFGDGNNDEITDEIQNNVATFTVATNIAITLISDNAALQLNTGQIINKEDGPETALLNINVKSIPLEFPSNEAFDLGAYSFSVKVTGNLDPNTALITIDVGVLLPVDVNVGKYYRFGPTPDNPVPHLYDFTFNNSTGLGARSLGKVTIGELAGDTIERNIVIISYLDGGLGDDDLTINGLIGNASGGFTTGAPATKDSSSGTMSLYSLLIFSIMLHLIRLKNRN